MRRDAALILLVFAVSLALRLLFILPSGFDGLYGQDPFAYYDFAAAVHNGQTPEPIFWPLGYPALLVIGFGLFGASAVVGQALNLVLGALLSPLVYALARSVNVGRFGALVAAILIAICGQALQSSIVIMADIPALAWATISAIVLLRYLRTESVRWLMLSAFMLAFASITRWLYLWLVPVWAVSVLIEWRGYIRWSEVLAASAAALIVLVPQFAYSATTPFPTLNHAWVTGWSPLNAFRSEFVNVDGTFVYSQMNALYYAQPFYEAYYLAPLFLPFLLGGAWLLVRQQRSESVLLLGWALLPILFLVGIPYQNLRFPLIVFPAVAVLVGIGFDVVLKTFNAVAQRHRAKNVNAVGAFRELRYRLPTLVLVAVLGIGAAHTLSISRSTINTFLFNQQRDREVAEWTAQQVPTGETIYTIGLTLTLQHYSQLNVRELFYETPNTLAVEWVEGDDDYLLLNLWDIEHQWKGREPEAAMNWLEQNRGLTRLGWFRNYTLYRIG